MSDRYFIDGEGFRWSTNRPDAGAAVELAGCREVGWEEYQRRLHEEAVEVGDHKPLAVLDQDRYARLVACERLVGWMDPPAEGGENHENDSEH